MPIIVKFVVCFCFASVCLALDDMNRTEDLLKLAKTSAIFSVIISLGHTLLNL